MSSRYAAIRSASISAPPGMALVRRLEGPSPAAPAHWRRVFPRLCLYALPALWATLLRSLPPIASVQGARSSANMHFLQIFLFAWIAVIECFQAGRCERANREHTGAMAILKSLFAAAGAAALLLLLLGLPLPGISICMIDAAVFLVASLAIVLSFHAVFDAQRPLTCLLLAVAHARAGAVSWELMRKEVSSHPISGAIRLEDTAQLDHVEEMLSTEDLLHAIRREQVDGVLISAPSSELSKLSRQIAASGGLDTPVRFVVDSVESSAPHGHVSSAGCLYLLNTGANPAVTINYTLFKRAFDIAFSLVVLTAGQPLLLLIALAVKLSSSGPVFFVQNRVGWNGRVFRMVKFRTMHTAPATESDTRWTPPGDAHRTAVGQFLRKYSLDELPQFLNVLKGDMSVVGPRPERPFFVSSFRRQIDEYHRRHQIKVGITGWAQVNGLRGDTCIRTRLLYDLYYLQNWGLVFDLKIVFGTVLCVFKGKNAY